MAAAGAATTGTSAAILKTKYTQPKVYWIAYKNNPSFANARKEEDFDGDSKVVAIQTEVPQGGGATIALAQTNAAAGIYKKFIVTRISDFGVARITGEALKAAEKNSGSLLALWTREMDGCIFNNKRSAAIHMQRSGTGSRGQISAGSTVGSVTISLATTSDITNFAVGMTLQASATDGGALRSAGATIVVTGINRTTGSLTAAGNWSTAIAAIAAGDFLVRNGDGAAGSTNLMMTGRAGWIPATDPTSTLFWTVDRSTDTVRLGGNRLNATLLPMQEAIQEATAIVQVEGANEDLVAYMHPRDRANFAKELGGKVEYSRVEAKVKGSEARIGFSAIKLETDSGNVTIMSDLNVPRGTVFLGDSDTEAIESLGPAPQILDFDSNEFLRITNDDSYEVRTGYYGNYTNAAPSFWCNISNFGA